MVTRALAALAFLSFSPLSNAAGPAPADQPSAAIKGEALLVHLNQVIRWYHLSEAGGQWLSQPSDEFFFTTERGLANQVLQKAFVSARGELPLVAAPVQKVQAAPNAAQQRIARATADRTGRVQKLRDEIDSLDARVQAAGTAQDRALLAARRDALQSEFNFYDALQRSLQTIGGMLASPGDQDAAATLAGQVEALAQSVPEGLAGAPAQAASVAPAVKAAESGGLIARTVGLFALMKDLRALDQFITETVRLQGQVDQMQAPLRSVVRDVITQGDQAGEHLADDPAQFASGKRRIDTLTERFKQLAAASMPLREEALLLDQSLHNLRQWRESVAACYSQIVRSLLARAVAILAMLAAVFGLSWLWRHMTFRYVQDDRRRKQFLTIRRFVTGGLMVGVLAIGFISDFSSIATFAGFATAGIAVALQTIIVSVAAYFFLIGRYGVRVGDRITVSGVSAAAVTGEVTELGIVRFHLMELNGPGPEAQPTGRSIVFPNSVIFLANPIYRQMPGADFAWREAAVPLVSGADAALARDRLFTAVEAALAEYRPLLEPQRNKSHPVHGVRLETPKPYVQLRARGRELAVVVGFPANLSRYAEVDQIVLRHLSDRISADPDLKAAVGGQPRLGPLGQA